MFGLHQCHVGRWDVKSLTAFRWGRKEDNESRNWKKGKAQGRTDWEIEEKKVRVTRKDF